MNRSLREVRKQRTRRGLANQIYANQRNLSKRRKHPMPNYSSKELYEWMVSQPNYNYIYNKWVDSGYDKWFRPSCDRLDDYKPYTLDNIRLVTWLENLKKSHNDRKSGINNKTSTPVIQYDLDGNKVGRYYSLHHATRCLGIAESAISNCCSGNIKTAGGYVFRKETN